MKLLAVAAAALTIAGATIASAQAPSNDGTPPPSQPNSPVDKQQDMAPTTGGTSSGNPNPTAGQAKSIPGQVGQDLSKGSAGTGAGAGSSPSPSTEVPAKNPADKQMDTQKSGQ